MCLVKTILFFGRFCLISVTSICPDLSENGGRLRRDQHYTMVELNLRSGIRPGHPGDFQRTRFKSGGCARIEKNN